MLRNASARRKKIASIIAFVSIPLSGFITDIYLPSFPSMSSALGVSADKIQLTLTCFFMSYGVSQLFIGSLLDTLGRYKPALYALAVLFISSLLIGITTNISLICLLRVVQGIATAFVIVSKRAFFVDLYEGDERKHKLSYLTIIWSLGPIIAPFLGGFLQKLFDWESNFFFLAGYAAIVFILELLFSGETVAEHKPFDLNKIRSNYAMMLGNIHFLLGILTLGLAYSVVMVFNIAGPFVVENSFHFNSVVTGYCTLILGFAWMTGGILNKRFHHVEFNKKISTASVSQIILTAILLLSGLALQQLWWLVLVAFFIHVGSGFIFTVNFTHNMVAFPENAGMASGLMGGMVYVITSISSFALSQTGKIATQQDMALRYVIMSAILTIVVLLTVRLSTRWRVSRTIAG